MTGTTGLGGTAGTAGTAGLPAASTGPTTSTPSTPSTGTATPEWLLRNDVALCPCGCIGRRRKGSFVEKTLTGGANVLRQAMFADEVAARPGLLQRLDPRVKLVTILALLIAVSLLRDLRVLAVCYLATLPLAAASGLPVAFFLRRVWLFVPTFTGLVVLPATLSVVTPGHVVLPLWEHAGGAGGVTAQGLLAAGLIVVRVATSISLVVLLTLTTPWARLLAALRTLGMPRIFVLIIGMAYRYLFLLLGTVSDMYTARKARSVGPATSGRSATRTRRDTTRARRDTAVQGRRFVAAGAGTLFAKAHHLSEEVHQAMTARGYRGDARPLTGFQVGVIDLVWSIAGLTAAAAMLLADLRLAG